jgi:hypothetical protein
MSVLSLQKEDKDGFVTAFGDHILMSFVFDENPRFFISEAPIDESKGQRTDD